MPSLIRYIAKLSVLFVFLAFGFVSAVAAADIVDSNNGIDFRVRLTSQSGVVAITWNVSRATLSTGANAFDVEYYVGGGTQWSHVVGTDEPTHAGAPVYLGAVPDLFCFRMIATVDGRGTIRGSGTSGNEPPCAAPPPADTDADGIPDSTDNCPTIPNTNQSNYDSDGQGDACDPDDDNDGVPDQSDDFPRNASESLDTDSDGIGNNADSDDDNDGVPDISDAFPLDANESVDTDGDGIGNNADSDDDDDGIPDSWEQANGLDPYSDDASIDSDGDGYNNFEEYEAGTHPNDKNDLPLPRGGAWRAVIPLLKQ